MTVTTATVVQIWAALADQLREQLTPAIPDLQVEGHRIVNPTPPVLDIYPGDPFSEQIAFDFDEQELLTIVRARVSMVDDLAGEERLLALMDTQTPESVLAAIWADRSLDSTVSYVSAVTVSGFVRYDADAVASNGSVLGCQWEVRIVR